MTIAAGRPLVEKWAEMNNAAQTRLGEGKCHTYDGEGGLGAGRRVDPEKRKMHMGSGGDGVGRGWPPPGGVHGRRRGVLVSRWVSAPEGG